MILIIYLDVQSLDLLKSTYGKIIVNQNRNNSYQIYQSRFYYYYYYLLLVLSSTTTNYQYYCTTILFDLDKILIMVLDFTRSRTVQTIKTFTRVASSDKDKCSRTDKRIFSLFIFLEFQFVSYASLKFQPANAVSVKAKHSPFCYLYTKLQIRISAK